MAASTKKFLIYKSSAGSGKTFRLSVEYIRLLLANPLNYRKILGSTFTNKAANEMKSKIIGYLNELSAIDPANPEEPRTPFYKTVKNETGLSDNIIKDHAAKALTFILHDYSDFSLMTLDKFTTRLARSYQHDLLIDNEFEVDLDVDGTVKKAIDDLFAMAGLNRQITEILTSYIWECITNNQDWKSEKMVQDFSGQIQKESALPYLERLQDISADEFREFIGESAAFVKKYRDQLKKIGKEGLEIFTKYHLEPGWFLYKERGLYGQLVKLEKGIDEINSYVEKSMQSGKWFSDQTKAGEKSQAEPHLNSLKELIHRYYNLRKHTTLEGIEDQKLFISLNAINRNIYAMALFHEISRVIHEYKEVNQLVFLSELNQRISDLVAAEQAPYIYERIGNQFSHILLDEFQDNSLLQWRNFIPLFENALSMNHLCLIVGDGKQSIYRWRNGVVEQFAELPVIYSPPDQSELWLNRQKLFSEQHEIQDLKENYRSDKAIVDFNNQLFDYLNNKYHSITWKIYDGLQQKVTKTGSGLVSLEFFDNASEDITEKTLSRILEIITRLDTKYSPRDMAVLCRKNSVACEVSRYLTAHGIPVVSSESITLNTSGRVKVIVSFLRLISSSDFRFYPVEISGLLLKTGRISQEMYHRFLQEIMPADKKPDENYQTIFFNFLDQTGISLDINSLNSMNLYEKTEYLARSLGFFDKPDPFTIFFQQAIKEFTRKSGNLTEDFLEWWDHEGQKKSIIIPPEHNAVKIMTIHKAKGLQFPVVIYPFANDKTDLSKNNIWVQGNLHAEGINSFLIQAGKDMANSIFSEQYQLEKNNALLDLINLLYVALTRATTRLYVLGTQVKNRDTESVSGLIQDFLNETGKQPDHQGRYIFGEDISDITQVFTGHKPSEKSDQIDFRAFSGNWHDRVLISQKNAEYFKPAQESIKAKKGKIIHEILAGWVPAVEINDLISKAELLHEISADETGHIRKMISQILSHPLLKEFYTADYQVLNEPEMMLPGGKIYRPDRILIKADEIHIIDYKTGEKSEHHAGQVRAYAKVTEDMGYCVKNLLLVYLLEDDIEVVRV